MIICVLVYIFLSNKHNHTHTYTHMDTTVNSSVLKGNLREIEMETMFTILEDDGDSDYYEEDVDDRCSCLRSIDGCLWW